MRTDRMADPKERSARLLVRALHYATDGAPRWWMLSGSLNDVPREALAVAVSKGWLLQRGDSVCLTDAGRKASTKSPECREC
jgi:hypothetical protein